MIAPIEYYKKYLAINLHFTTDYNFHTYNGKTNVNEYSFEKSKYKYKFVNFSRKYNLEEFEQYLVSAYVYGDVKRMEDLVSDDADKNYKRYLRNHQSISYVFEEDLDKIIYYCEMKQKEFDSVVDVKNGQYPKLLKLFLQNEITFETMIILEQLLHFVNEWEEQIQDNILWPTILKKWKKYEPWVKVNTTKFRFMLKNKLTTLA